MEAAAGCRAHRHRAGAVRRGRPSRCCRCPADPQPPPALSAVRSSLPRLRPRRGPPPLAGARPWRDPSIPRGRCAQGLLPRARRDRRGNAVGAAWRLVHPRLRGHLRVACGPHLPVGGRRAAAGRVAHGRAGLHASRRRAGHQGGPVAGLRRIGVDEIAYKKGHRYLTVVVDHDTGRLVWAAPGRDEQTLERFFDTLGDDRARKLTHLSADAAAWIANVAARRCPQAVLCLDPFHVVKWATDALDVVRREVWNAARRSGQPALARQLKGARFALWKNPEHLTVRQRGKLARVADVNQHLYKAYLLKEELRLVFKLKGARAVALLDAWLSRARRCRIPAFVKLARSITDHRAGIQASLLYGLSNGLVESVNTKLRLLTRIAFGFHSPDT